MATVANRKALFVTLERHYLKHTELSFSPISIDSLGLRVAHNAYISRSGDFGVDNNKTNYFTACAWDNNNNTELLQKYWISGKTSASAVVASAINLQ